MLRIHLSGMGLVGCLLACELERLGLGFTWSDSEASVTAWKASTGCVYPSGEAVDLVGYNRWAAMLAESSHAVCRFSETASYGFTQKSIPHGAGSKLLRVARSHGSVKVLNKPSFHVNVQGFVLDTRQRLAGQRSRPKPGEIIVHSHGYHGKFVTDYRWGWSAPCFVRGGVFEIYPRMCLNAKEGRFINAYLYPRPGTDHFYLGTSFIYQKAPKPLEMEGKLLKIVQHIKRVAGGGLEIEVAGSPVAGWRPVYSEDGLPVCAREENELFVRPQAANGLRHSPVWIDRVIREIKRVALQL